MHPPQPPLYGLYSAGAAQLRTGLPVIESGPMRGQGRQKSAARRGRPTQLRAEPPAGGDARAAPLIARETADKVRAIGLRRPWFGDLYHFALRLSWCSFLLGGVALYVAAN